MNSAMLPLMEAFYTVQGEGRYTGHAAYFIRLGGCDVGCVWCDVKESWDASLHPNAPINEIVAAALLHPARLAVVTGGEPLMYDLTELTNSLSSFGFKTHLETSGAHILSGIWDWICLSPKKFKPPVESIYLQADELKVVIYHKSDFEWAERHAEKVRPDCELFLQPEWGKQAEVSPLIVEYIKAYPKWKISTQSHKFLNIP